MLQVLLLVDDKEDNLLQKMSNVPGEGRREEEIGGIGRGKGRERRGGRGERIEIGQRVGEELKEKSRGGWGGEGMQNYTKQNQL